MFGATGTSGVWKKVERREFDIVMQVCFEVTTLNDRMVTNLRRPQVVVEAGLRIIVQ